MHWMPPIFLVGIILNVALCIIFKLRLDRQQTLRFVEFRDSLSSQVSAFSKDAMSSIDSYFVSNYVSRTSAPSDFVAPHVDGDMSPILRDVGDWRYTYFEASGVRYARVGSRNYKEGDIFPRGGVISAIHPDGVVLDRAYWVRNQMSSQSSEFTPTIKSNIKEIKR